MLPWRGRAGRAAMRGEAWTRVVVVGAAIAVLGVIAVVVYVVLSGGFG